MNNVVAFITDQPAVLYDRAKTALAECHSIDECAEWRNKSAAIEEYARQRDDHELLNLAHKIKGRAVRRIGQLLGEIEPSKGGYAPKFDAQDGTDPSITRKSAAQAAGLSERKAKEALRVANVDEQRFEESLAQGMPLSSIADMGTERKPISALIQRVDPMALDLWGWFKTFERDSFIDMDHVTLMGTMTEPMRRDMARIAPEIRRFINLIEDSIHA